MKNRKRRRRSSQKNAWGSKAYENLEPRQLLAALPVITEFAASNVASLIDGNGEASDWIEIQNQGTSVAQLDDYFLTDDASELDKWQFPAGATLGVGQYLIVFASGSGVADGSNNLHTNFSLRAGGEYIALSDASASVLSEYGANGADYPAQFTDVSYGEGALGTTGYFFNPTPGLANGVAEASFSQREVNFSRAAGTFTESSFQLALSTDTVGGQILFTVDGTDPTLQSTTYTSPISISDSINVRARVFTPSGTLGPVFGAAYTELATELDTRTSELPIVVLDNFGDGDVTGTSQTFAFSLYDVDPISGISSLASAPDVVTPSGLNTRGSSSSGFPKKQYRLELRDQAGDDLDFSLAGLAEESDWVLFGPYVDKSLIRNPLTYELGRQLGLEAPNTRFVEVYLNSGTSNSTLSESDYVGVYTIRENLKISENRLDIAELSPTDIAEPDITGGYLLRFDVGLEAGSLVYETRDNHRLQLVDQEDYTDVQKDWISNYVADFVSVLNGPNFADPVNGYAKYIDVDSFINLMLINELSRDQDAYFRSNYLYKDRGGKLTQGPLWDYNLTFDIGSARGNTRIDGWQYQRNGSFVGAQWISRLLQDPNFELKFRDRWAEARQTVYSDANINGIIDGLVADLGTAPDRNVARWGLDATNFNSPVTQTYGEQIDIIRDWSAARLAWIDSQLLDPAPPVISPGGGGVSAGTAVSIASPVAFQEVVLLDTSDAARGFVPTDNSLETGAGPLWFDPSFDDSSWTLGTNGVGYDNNGNYSGLIGTDLQFDWDANESSIYSRFEFQVSSSDLNQIQFLTLDINADDGFVVYLNGQQVDSRRAPASTNWQSHATSQLSDSDVINTGDTLDLTQFKNLLVAGTNLLAVHGLNLNDASSDLVVRPRLSAQLPASNPVFYTTDGSDPRNPDGTISAAAVSSSQPLTINQNTLVNARTFVGGQWSALSNASFVIGAFAPQTDLRITEINYNPYAPSAAEVAQGFTLGDDFEFIEFTNTSLTNTLNLAGMQISNGVSFVFGDVNLLPGERAVVVEDTAAFVARYGTSAKVLGQWSGGLSNGGEQILLLDSAAQEVMSVNYNDNDPWAITADGVGATLVLNDPFNTPLNELGKHYRWSGSVEYGGTPGAAGTSPESVVINEILANSDLVDLDSIELFNPTSQSIDIGGWYLSDSGNNLLKFQIPIGTVLSGGQYIVFDESDFNPTPLTPGPNDFALSGSMGDQVYLVAPSAGGGVEFVAHVDFGASLSGQTLGRTPNGTGRFAPLATNTLGATNSSPVISDVVISEVNFHPEDPSGSAIAIDSTLIDNDLEYIEIFNTSATTVDLTNWRIRGESDFEFATGLTLDANEALLVVSFDPTLTANANKVDAFRAHYGIASTVPLVGGFSAGLSNSEGRVELEFPDVPPADNPTFVPHVTADEVLYDDLAPWYPSTDGTGPSLQRVAYGDSGNLASSWTALAPSPGVAVAAPTVTAAVAGNGTNQRSTVDSLTLTFDGLVTLDPGAINVIQRGDASGVTGTAVGTTFTAVPDNGNTILTISFTSSTRNSFGALNDGSYQLTLDHTKVKRTGGAVVMSEDYVFGAVQSDGFYTYYGDSNGDLTLSRSDLLSFRRTYRRTVGTSGFNSSLDFDANGDINRTDLVRFRQSYRRTLAWV